MAAACVVNYSCGLWSRSSGSQEYVDEQQQRHKQGAELVQLQCQPLPAPRQRQAEVQQPCQHKQLSFLQLNEADKARATQIYQQVQQQLRQLGTALLHEPLTRLAAIKRRPRHPSSDKAGTAVLDSQVITQQQQRRQLWRI
eukprot:gene5256-5491_t